MLQYQLQFFTLVAISFTLITATLSPPTAAVKSEKLLSRKRRYVAFPDGSSVAASICLTIGVIGNPSRDYLSWAENWGVAYNLPNYTWARQNAHGFKNDLNKKTKGMVQRRSRRDLYAKIEMIIENMGFDGHACIARALCESSKYLQELQHKRRGNMIEQIVKMIFSFPAERVHISEPNVIHQYDRIYRRAKRDVRDCSVTYAQCQFSLLELALGKYSVEPTKHDGHLMPLQSYAFM